METLHALRTRRSTRAFTPDPVPRETLALILEAGQYAPSAMNSQKWQFTAITKPEHLDQIAVTVRDGLRETGRELADDYCCHYHAPALIIVSLPRDYRFVGEDGACALENMFLAAHALGLGACWINQLGPVCEKPAMRALLTELGMPSDHVICGCAAVGGIAKVTPVRPRAEGTIHFA